MTFRSTVRACQDRQQTLCCETVPTSSSFGHLSGQCLLEHLRDGYAHLEEIRDPNFRISDYRILEINAIGAKTVGLSRENLLNKRLTQVFAENPPSRAILTAIMRSIDTSIEHKDYEGELKEAAKWFRWSIRRTSKRSIWILFRDTTFERLTSDDLQAAPQWESLGVLAAGIAHEFNNLFQGIVGNICVAKEMLENPQIALSYLEKALTVTERAKNLSNQLLTFSKGGAPNKQKCCIERVIKDVLNISLLGQNIEGVADIEDGIWPCEADETQVRQAIANIVLNAAESGPANGKVFVKAQNVRLAADNAMKLPRGPYLLIAVSDSGIGIPERIQQQVVDPFFSTKPCRRGLGLTAAFSIITKHGGSLTIESEHLVGTVVTVYLPAIEQTAASDDRLAPQTPMAGHGGRILVMDDEQFIRETLSLMLQAKGFETASVENGEQAIEAYRESMNGGRKFDAVIVDLTIRSGIGGREVIEYLRQLDPNVRAIVSSGYSSDQVMSDPHQFGFRAVLPKPYGVKELTKALAITLPEITEG